MNSPVTTKFVKQFNYNRKEHIITVISLLDITELQMMVIAFLIGVWLFVEVLNNQNLDELKLISLATNLQDAFNIVELDILYTTIQFISKNNRPIYKYQQDFGSGGCRNLCTPLFLTRSANRPSACM